MWHLDVLGEEICCGSNVMSTRGWDIETVASIMVHCRSEVPVLHPKWGPRAVFIRIFKDWGPCAGRGKRCLIEVVHDIEMGMGGETWVRYGCREQVKGADGTFSNVHAVIMQFHKLQLQAVHQSNCKQQWPHYH
eukprot:6784228-Ditylum_brightwellii.AAC.1